MNTPTIKIIGTRMPIEDVSKYLGYEPLVMAPEITKIIREICIIRDYLKKTIANKMKLYRVPSHDMHSLTNGKVVMIETLTTGNSWHPDVAFFYSDYKDTEQIVNAKYPYGNMDSAMRSKYITDMSIELGDKLFQVNLLN